MTNKKKKHKSLKSKKQNNKSNSPQVTTRLFYSVSSFLKNNYLKAFITILFGIPTFTLGIYQMYKTWFADKGIKIYLDEFEICNEEFYNIIYLYPTSEIKSAPLLGKIPIKLQNIGNDDIENLTFDLSTKLIEKNQGIPKIDKNPNSILKLEQPKKEYEKLRFLKECKIIGLERMNFIFKNNEFARYKISQFTSNLSIEIHEPFNIIRSTFDNIYPEDEKAAVIDYFETELKFTYTDIPKVFSSTITITILDFNSLNDFVTYTDTLGIIPATNYKVYPENKKAIKISTFIIIPSVIYDDKVKSYIINNYSFYKLKQEDNNYYHDRKLILENKKSRLEFQLSDINISRPNRSKINDSLQRIMYFKK
ncbi:MAG: hypothetical protein IJD32_02120 [Bacteroidaceae bacterium]|nr:hypothetical protein [Bacteroidaceae bacterium]